MFVYARTNWARTNTNCELYDVYPQQKFVEEQLLTHTELELLLPKLQAVGQKISCDFSIWQEQWELMQKAGEQKPNDMADGRLVPSRYFDVRVNASGLAEFNGGLQSVQLRPETTVSIFEEQMRALYRGLPSFFQTEKVSDSSDVSTETGMASLEQCSSFADTLTLSGWYICPEGYRPTHLQLASTTVLVEHLSRPDVAAKHQIPSGWICSGFRTVLPCANKIIPVPTLIYAKNGRSVCQWQFSGLPG